MARLLKNPDLAPGVLAARLPIASDSLGDTPTNGLIRFNTDHNRIEFYYNNSWNKVAKIGAVELVVTDVVGDGVTQAFTMTRAETDPRAIAVFIGGVYQQPNVHYTLGDSTPGVKTTPTNIIVFTSAPPAPTINPNRITIIHNLNSTDAE
jgi:hypothetical protein